jgi:hypothetical protein
MYLTSFIKEDDKVKVFFVGRKVWRVSTERWPSFVSHGFSQNTAPSKQKKIKNGNFFGSLTRVVVCHATTQKNEKLSFDLLLQSWYFIALFVLFSILCQIKNTNLRTKTAFRKTCYVDLINIHFLPIESFWMCAFMVWPNSAFTIQMCWAGLKENNSEIEKLIWKQFWNTCYETL